jgi:hypothetical protein
LLAALGGINPVPKIARSEDGVNWNFTEGLQDISEVYDLLESQGRLYAAGKAEAMGWVYQADLIGQRWQKTAPLPDPDIRAVLSLAQSPDGEIFAGTEMVLGPSATKVFVKSRNTEHWQEFGGIIDLANNVNSLIFVDNRLFAGTGPIYGNIYQCFRTPATALEMPVINQPPPQFYLAQNFPNPFNQQTLIKFQLDNDGEHSLSIYNMKGELVRCISQGIKPAGTYNCTWDGKDANGIVVASGIYWCHLKQQERQARIKLLLIK